MGSSQDQKVAENRLRRMAARRGWTVEKSRSRDPLALDFGLWMMKFVDDHEFTRYWAEGTLDEITALVEAENISAYTGKPKKAKKKPLGAP